MQYPQFQQSYAQPQQPQQGIDPRAHIMGSLQALGLTTAQFAQIAERVGIGHAAAIQQALENGDARPIVQYAHHVAQNNPQALQIAGAHYGRMYGNPMQQSGWQGNTQQQYRQ